MPSVGWQLLLTRRAVAHSLKMRQGSSARTTVAWQSSALTAQSRPTSVRPGPTPLFTCRSVVQRVSSSFGTARQSFEHGTSSPASGDILTLDQLAPELLRSLVDTAGLGASAHVAACVRQGAKLLCLPDSRNSSLYTVVPRGGVSPLPMERALAGGRGTAHGVDYRGHNVVAAVGLLASGFGLIAKEDTLDAYAPIRLALGQGVPIILVVTLLGGILMTWQLAPLVARLRRSEQLASEASAKNAAIMHAAGDAIVTIDHLGHMLAVNDAAHRIFGYADGELAGRKVAMLMPEASRAAHEHGLARVVAGGTPRLVGVSNVQVRGLRSDGCEFPLELTLSAVPLPDNMLFVGVMRDITERRAMEDKLSHMAQFDSLTGLPNRALFMDRLDTAMTRAGRSHRALAVMFLDLDGFKAINDTLGHRAGDDVLVQIAERLASAVRRSDTVARLGGDEFTILLEELVDPDADAHAIADKVLAALRSPLKGWGPTAQCDDEHWPGGTQIGQPVSHAVGALESCRRRHVCSQTRGQGCVQNFRQRVKVTWRSASYQASIREAPRRGSTLATNRRGRTIELQLRHRRGRRQSGRRRLTCRAPDVAGLLGLRCLRRARCSASL